MAYPILDTLRGHPDGPHGSQPKNFVGLWVRDESIEYDFVGQAFYLMANGRWAGSLGMTSRRWHYDDSRLYVDSVSRCGNCYRGNVTVEYAVQWVAADRALISSKDGSSTRGINGKYRKIDITEDLKADLERLRESPDENESFRARSVLRAIESFERLSQPKRA